MHLSTQWAIRSEVVENAEEVDRQIRAPEIEKKASDSVPQFFISHKILSFSEYIKP